MFSFSGFVVRSLLLERSIIETHSSSGSLSSPSSVPRIGKCLSYGKMSDEIGYICVSLTSYRRERSWSFVNFCTSHIFLAIFVTIYLSRLFDLSPSRLMKTRDPTLTFASFVGRPPLDLWFGT